MSDRQKLLLLYPSRSCVCGVGSWIDLLVKFLPQHGWDVTVGLTHGSCHNRADVIEQFWPDWNTVRLNAQSGTEISRELAIASVIERVRPNVVLSTLLLDGVKASGFVRPKVRRSIAFGVANHGNSPRDLSTIIESARYLDFASTVNRLSYEVLRTCPGSTWGTKLLKVIPNAVSEPLRPREVLTGETLEVIFVGRLTAEKGVSLLPEIVRKLRQKVKFRLRIAGDGPGLDSMVRLREEFPNEVEVLGGVSRKRLYEEVYPQAHALLGCSISEGWPLAIAEAMAHGVVPVTSAFCGLYVEGLLKHGVNSLVYGQGDVEGAVKSLASLSDKRLCDSLGSSASESIIGRFSLSNFATNWNDFLNQVVEEVAVKSQNDSVRLPIRKRRMRYIKETVRELLGRKVNHPDAGSEWPTMRPSSSGLIDDVSRWIDEVNRSAIPAS